jgi:hypothetical protein
MGITIVNQSVGNITYTVFGGSASGSGIGSGVSPSGGGSGVWPSGGSGAIASGVIPSGGSASGISVSGSPSYTVVFGWEKFPSYTVSASGVVTIATNVKP